MSVEQAVIEKLRVLSPEKQQEVLNFAEFLESRANGQQPRSKKWEGMSALEAAEKYAGCLEGPEDLSTNPKYMQGFGE